MKKICSWIRLWFVHTRAEQMLSGSFSRLDRLERDAAESAAELNETFAELERLYERAKTELFDARRLHMRYESALEEVREQNRVLETTIKTLVASHQLLMERYDAETALQVRTRVAAAQRE